MILEELLKRKPHERASFHMPGHKNGAGFVGTPLECELFSIDTTELCDTDALIAPEGMIKEAQEAAARAYGAAHSFYLVNGSTCGILSMFYAAFSAGDLVLVDRNCHQSVVHALMLCGARPVYMMPGESSIPDVPGVVSADMVKKLLEKYPAVRGVFLTSPNYYGMAAELSRIAELVHEHGALLLVDEAHGAHFPFSCHFPRSAMEQGADYSVTSLHKSLCSPNQTALLHIGKGIDPARVREAVRIFQTSSPSYIFMAAMEQAVHFGMVEGSRKTDEVLALAGGYGIVPDDPFKRILNYTEKGYSGYEVEEILRTRFGIYAELYDVNLVLLMLSWANTKKDFDLLGEAIRYLDALPAKKREAGKEPAFSAGEEMPALSPQQVRESEQEYVPLARAEGRICATTVTAFPPCIPVLLPGEMIGKEQIEFLSAKIAKKDTITGLVDNEIKVLAKTK